MPSIEPNETSKTASASDGNKENFSISEDERDIIDGVTFLVGGRKSSASDFGGTMSKNQSMEPRKSDAQVEASLSFGSPTTVALIRENNQVLCPLSRKTGPLRRYCGSYAKFTFVSPNGEFEDETTASYLNAQSRFNDEGGRGKLACTCCSQCRFCRRFSDFRKKSCIDATTQTDSVTMNTAATAIGSSLESGKSSCAVPMTAEKAEKGAPNRVVCTYLADASDEFYPFSTMETRQESNVEKSSQGRPAAAIPMSSTPLSQADPKQRRLRFKGKETNTTTNTADLFLSYLKLLILRRKEKFSEAFWQSYGSVFDTPPCMSTKEVQLCQRRFGEGYDVEQLERMLPLALKSSDGEWRRETPKLSSASKQSRASGQRSEPTPQTPISQYIRIDRTDPFRSTKPKRSRKLIVSKDIRSVSVRSTPMTPSSPSSTAQNASATPSKLRPIKLNRAAILRADAIFCKYWRTP